MNPNNYNLDYLLKLPTPRLLAVYRKYRKVLYLIHDWDWSDYDNHKGTLDKMPQEEREKIPRFVPHETTGRPVGNRLFFANDIYKVVKLTEALKEELDHRENVSSKVAK